MEDLNFLDDLVRGLDLETEQGRKRFVGRISRKLKTTDVELLIKWTGFTYINSRAAAYRMLAKKYIKQSESKKHAKG